MKLTSAISLSRPLSYHGHSIYRTRKRIPRRRLQSTLSLPPASSAIIQPSSHIWMVFVLKVCTVLLIWFVIRDNSWSIFADDADRAPHTEPGRRYKGSFALAQWYQFFILQLLSHSFLGNASDPVFFLLHGQLD